MFTPFAFIKRQVSAAIATIQKVLIAGGFTSFRAVNYNNIIKTTPTTAIDTTFNMGTGANNSIYASAIDENGKILIGGNFTSYSGSTQNYFTRINTNGTRDTTFNTGGGTNGLVYTVLPVSQSKILIGGAFSTYSGSAAIRIARLNSNGTLDSTFAVTTNPLLDNSIYTFATQSDGKIIVGGVFQNTIWSSNYLSKLTPQLIPDTTFNPVTGLNAGVYAFATQSDGKIVVGGAFTTYSGSTVNRIVRINTDGTRDTTFNVGTGFSSGEVDVIRVQSDGKILVGGSFLSYSGSTVNRITRINTDGTRDTTFNQGTGFNNGQVYDLQLQSDGKIIAVGTWTLTYSGSSAIRIARINPSGSLDTTFNSGTTGFSANQYSAQIQNDGKIIVVGLSATYSGSAVQRIRRINTNGTLDTTFNIGTAGFNNTTYRARIQPDQKIVVLGVFTSYSGSAINRIARINTNGTLDTTFNPGTGFNSVTQILSGLELDSSGSIYVGSNFATYNSATANYFVKLTSSGSIITGSGQYIGFNNVVNSLLVDSTGSVYAGGAFNGPISPNNYIVRLNTDGTKDYSFQIGTGFQNTVYSLQVQSDDKIVVGGTFTTYSGSGPQSLVRLNSNGTRDTSFSMGSGFNNYVYKTLIQSDGKILVGGSFTTYSGSTQNYITRLNSNGSVDTTFNIGTGAEVSSNGFPIGLIQDQSGSIHYGNPYLTVYSGSSVTGYVKLTPSGSIDSTFLSTAVSASSTPGAYTAGTSGTGVQSISIDSSNNAYLFGNFQNYLPPGSKKILALNLTQGDISTPPYFNFSFKYSVNISAKDPSGNIWVAGPQGFIDIGSTANVAKLSPQGNLITYFLNNFVSQTALYPLPDGKILISANTPGDGTYPVYRFNSNGIYDNTFQMDTGSYGSALAIGRQSTGKIIIGGDFYNFDLTPQIQYFLRLNPSGSVDTTFVGNSGFNNYVYSINVLPDDSMIIGGLFGDFNGQTINKIAKIDADGYLDTSFLTSLNSYAGFYDNVYKTAIQPDGKIIVIGSFDAYYVDFEGGYAAFGIARLNSDGTYDSTFNTGNGFYGSSYFANSRLCKIIIDQDNNIHIVGDFTYYNGVLVNGYVKLSPNGTLLPAFDGSITSPIGINAINSNIGTANTIELIDV